MITFEASLNAVDSQVVGLTRANSAYTCTYQPTYLTVLLDQHWATCSCWSERKLNVLKCRSHWRYIERSRNLAMFDSEPDNSRVRPRSYILACDRQRRGASERHLRMSLSSPVIVKTYSHCAHTRVCACSRSSRNRFDSSGFFALHCSAHTRTFIC